MRGFTQPFVIIFFIICSLELTFFVFKKFNFLICPFFVLLLKNGKNHVSGPLQSASLQGGVMTSLSDSFDYEVVQWKRYISGRVVSVANKVNDYCINLGNIYALTNLTKQKVFFETLQ